jgi:hypothetical protein
VEDSDVSRRATARITLGIETSLMSASAVCGRWFRDAKRMKLSVDARTRYNSRPTESANAGLHFLSGKCFKIRALVEGVANKLVAGLRRT